MKVQYYEDRRKYCIGVLVGRVESLITIDSANELHRKLGDVLTSVAKAKAVPQPDNASDPATSETSCPLCGKNNCGFVCVKCALKSLGG